ncbi:MAG TPA: protein-glutamate O-methyltransferase CheR [Spirochaetota bacterium]|nr:protein-glutamate O-methyltransferase CheR [Spirochaetota bacterium]HOM37531.1 protein-glutamate O-methyltransferase CheR [Spirochaetota bacterium]HPQ49497.1 protein-glutamate O-methyltransferase CheR [Spirochaetota bacterium]
MDYLSLFKELIHNESGIFFDDSNMSILDSRLRERLRLRKLSDFSEYYNLVKSDKKELEELLDSVTTNLTKFFRNPRQFDSLREIVLPEVIERNKITRKIKIWSAGCSTGEEPYSIAMEVFNALPNINLWNVIIIASDISLKSLMKAKAGYYPKERIENFPDDYLRKYMVEEKEGYKVKEELKSIIRFDYHNLKNDNGERDFDIIFCRNVIIYFDKNEQERIINHFYNCLKKPGYLFLGHSESLFGMNTPFKPKKIGDSFIYIKE